MKERNSCYTYFRICGKFDPLEVAELLNVKPYDYFKIGDEIIDGKRRTEASLSVCRCDEYDVMVENQMIKTIAPLTDKIDILNELRERLGLEYYLEVVPTIFVEQVSPCLSPSMEVIDFCHYTRTEIDVDMYLYSEKD